MQYLKTVAFATIVLSLALSAPASASHSWGSYHWARTANPFNLKLGDNVTLVWDSHLSATSTDWSVSSVLDTTVVAGSTNPKNCQPKAGQVEVCNSKYGNNGWLGVAQIWASGNHITQGAVKLNDTYFNTVKYNTPAWRQFVVCQEVGHTFGLDHQDENFSNANLGTCMDYTSDPATNQHPNQHDYDQLALIYAHLDSTSLSILPVPLREPKMISRTTPRLGAGKLRRTKTAAARCMKKIWAEATRFSPSSFGQDNLSGLIRRLRQLAESRLSYCTYWI